MKHLLIIFLFPLCCGAQTAGQIPIPGDSTFLQQARQFVNELYTPGIELKKDSLYVSDEFRHMLNDSLYRNAFFPSSYTWSQTVELLKQKKLKQAFWYLINLYPQDEKSKELVLQVILNYDKIFEMDKILTSTLYTYSFFDPRIGTMKSGKPEITHPDIFEKMMNDVKAMNGYIQHFRKNPPAKN